MSQLIPDDLKSKMICNAYDVMEDRATDYPPVIMLSSVDDTMAWLLTEIDPFYDDIAFGLCDLGIECPELGNVAMCELEEVVWPVTGIAFIVQDKEFLPPTL